MSGLGLGLDLVKTGKRCNDMTKTAAAVLHTLMFVIVGVTQLFFIVNFCSYEAKLFLFFKWLKIVGKAG